MSIKNKNFLDAKYGRMTLARFLKAYRLAEELTQTELAERLDWPKGNICDIESGRRVIGTNRANLLSQVTGIPLDYILEIILNQQLKEAGVRRYIKVEFE